MFDAISIPEHLNNWWTLKCSGQAAPSTSYNFYFAPEYNWWGTVVVYIPEQSFHIKMTEADTDWNPTTFGFDLEARAQETYLRFSQTGWQENNDHFKHSSFCWALLLNGLKQYLEEGTIIPFGQRK